MVIQFLAELLEEKWRSNNITKIPFYHNTNAFYKGGELIIHNNKKDFLTKDEIFLLLYVYDCALSKYCYILFSSGALIIMTDITWSNDFEPNIMNKEIVVRSE